MKLKTELPEEFEAEYEGGTLKVTREEDEVSKRLEHAMVDVEVEDDTVVFSTESDRRNVKSIVGTFQSHLENMIEGLQEEHIYRLKGVYAHFPMTIKQENNQVKIENFMGERAPRTIDIIEGAEVSIDGEDIEVRGADKEAVSQTAARIEQVCFKGDRDPRTFQDGVYIVGGDSE